MRHTIIDNEFGHLQYEIDPEGNYFIHLSLDKWSKTLYKEYLIIFYNWLARIKQENNINHVFVVIPENDKKLYKFEQMFGFNEIKKQDGDILMALTI